MTNSTDPATNNPTNIVTVPSVPHVQLIVTNSSGEVMAAVGGENQPLAKALHLAAVMDHSPVRKQDNVLIALGQDIYHSDREFVLTVIGLFVLSMPWADVKALPGQLPTGANYTFVVTR